MVDNTTNTSNSSFASRLAMFDKKKDEKQIEETRVKSRTLYQKSSIKIDEKLDQDNKNTSEYSELNQGKNDEKLKEVVKSTSFNDTIKDNPEPIKKEGKKIKFEVTHKESIENNNDKNSNKITNNNINTDNNLNVNKAYSTENKPLEKKDSKKDLSDRKSMFNFENTKNSLNEMFKKRMTVKSTEDSTEVNQNININSNIKDTNNSNHNKEDKLNDNYDKSTSNTNTNITDLTAFKTNVISKNKISKPKFQFHPS